MLIDFTISTLQSAFSYAIKHHITEHKKWKNLSQKPILLRLEHPEIKIYCIIKEDSVILRRAEEHEAVAASITTNFTTLLQTIQGQNKKKQITIQGQSKIASLLANYMQQFTPNFEGMLAPVIGKGSAYAITTQCRKASQRLQKNIQNLQHSAGDYISHECKLTPSKHELKKFYRDVDRHHNAIEKLIAKYEKFQQQEGKKNVKK